VISAAFKAVASFESGMGRSDSYALPPVINGASRNPQTSGDISTNKRESTYENSGSTGTAEGATSKEAATFPQPSNSLFGAKSKHIASTNQAPDAAPVLPDDLAAVFTALEMRWPEMGEGEKAAIKALAGVKA